MLRIKLSLMLLFLSTTACAASVNYQDHYFTQQLNHADKSDHRTFQQRYYYDQSAATNTDSPVILYVGDEGELGFLLADSFVPEIAHELHAYFIALEHRYYGKTQPFALLTKENLAYLNYENALADIAAFQYGMQQTKGLHGKWIVIGQSYGGNLAAFYHLKYPTNTIGALASSPAVKSVTYWPEYDKAAAEKAGKDCVKQYRTNVLTPIENALQNPAAMSHYKQLFEASDISSDSDFIYVLSSMNDVMVSMVGPEKLCNSVNSNNAMTTYSQAFLAFMHEKQFKLSDFVDSGINDLHASAYEQGMGQRQWAYQFCTEFADLTIANPDPALSFITRAVPEDALSVCRRAFDISIPPNAELNNQRYYYPLFSKTTSHIMIVNGTNDPAATLSISDMNGNNTNPHLVVHDIIGGAHHAEFAKEKVTDTAEVKRARRLEIAVLKQWLSE